jgi:hypothetical protein
MRIGLDAEKSVSWRSKLETSSTEVHVEDGLPLLFWSRLTNAGN